MKSESLIIIGSGPAGLTAGIYAARAGLSPLVIEGMLSGGQLTETAEVENFPGFAESVSGLDLMTSMHAQAERAGVRFAMDAITSVDFSGQVHRLVGMTDVYEARCVIIATGATPRWTGLPGEEAYRYHGISSCAVCDGNFHKGKDVAVIGGGDTALADAIHLAKICRSVTLIHRRDSFRGTKVLMDRVTATLGSVNRDGNSFAEHISKLLELCQFVGITDVDKAGISVSLELLLPESNVLVHLLNENYLTLCSCRHCRLLHKRKLVRSHSLIIEDSRLLCRALGLEVLINKSRNYALKSD